MDDIWTDVNFHSVSMDHLQIESSIKFCFNCSNPLTSFNSTVNEIISDSTEWKKALNSIFKLNYLDAFRTTTTNPNQIQIEENELCQNCIKFLLDLNQLYNNFLQLGKIDSCLSKKLARLDEIMDLHLQKRINCDLISQTTCEQEETECLKIVDRNSTQNFGAQVSFDIVNNNNNNNNSNNNYSDSIKEEAIVDLNSETVVKCNKRQLRVVLTRLPSTSTKIERKEQDFNCDSPSQFLSSFEPECPELLPEIKFEELDAHDDLMDYGNEDFPLDSDSSIGYIPPTPSRKSKKKKSTISSPSSSSLSRRQSKRSKIKVTTKVDSKVTKSHLNVTPHKQTRRVKPTSTSTLNKNQRQTKRPKKSSRYTERLRPADYLGRKTKHPNPCWYCKRHFPTPEDCLEHTRSEHLPKISNAQAIIICERCSKICYNTDTLTKHLEQCNLIPSGQMLPKQYPCPQCSKSFGSAKWLKNHLVTHSNDRPFECDKCDYKAKFRMVIERHQKNVHGDQVSEQVVCKECGTVLKNQFYHDLHVTRMHTVEGSIKYRRLQRIALDREKEERRIKAAQTTTVCSDCGVDFFARLAYFNHRKSFHGDHEGSEYVCHECGKSFTRRDTLTLHTNNVHSEARPFICEQCGKSFKRNYNLKAHVNHTHNDEGRLQYNKSIREWNRRVKIRAAQLANQESVQIQPSNPVSLTQEFNNAD